MGIGDFLGRFFPPPRLGSSAGKFCPLFCGQLLGPCLAAYQAATPAERDSGGILAFICLRNLSLPRGDIGDEFGELIDVAGALA